jgi:GntR family transcriptional regulator
MSDQPLALPLYQRVFGVLRQRIKNGVYAPRSQLAPEPQLAAEFGVSKGTIRQALGELADRRLIVRKQGAGTFISDVVPQSRIDDGPADLGALPARESGLITILSHEVRSNALVPHDVLAIFATEAHRSTAIREVRGAGDREPFAYAITWPSPAIRLVVTRETRADSVISSVLDAANSTCTVERTLVAELSDVDASTNLQITLGSPVMFSRQVFLAGRRPLVVRDSWFRGDRYRWGASFEVNFSDGSLSLKPQSLAGALE